MHLEAKQKIVAALDEVSKGGAIAPWTLTMHPDTARDASIHATHIDLGSERLFQSEDQIHAELVHPDYDPLEGKGPGRPKDDGEARLLAKARCQKALRRPGIVLVVVLDPSVAVGKFRVAGTRPVGMEV